MSDEYDPKWVPQIGDEVVNAGNNEHDTVQSIQCPFCSQQAICWYVRPVRREANL